MAPVRHSARLGTKPYPVSCTRRSSISVMTAITTSAMWPNRMRWFRKGGGMRAGSPLGQIGDEAISGLMHAALKHQRHDGDHDERDVAQQDEVAEILELGVERNIKIGRASC